MTEFQTVSEVADGVFRVYLPLPFALNIVNVYLLRGPQGWTIVDCGINTEKARDTWREAFQTLNIKPRHIEKIVMTHVHPDHFGLSGWLEGIAKEDGGNPPIYASPSEVKQAKNVWWREDVEDFYRYLASSGMPTEMAQTVAKGMGSTRQMTRPLPTDLHDLYPETLFQMGERTFRAILAPGHSDGQLLFYDADDKLLLSGDHVLMKITPNIGLWPDTQSDPLGRFIQSLNELMILDVRLALPGHRHLIEDWRGRIKELIEHHETRLERTLTAVESGAQTIYEASLKIFESERFSPHEWRFAAAETLAHLEHLRGRGQLLRDEGTIPHYFVR